MYSVKVESNFINNQPQRREKVLEGHALHIHLSPLCVPFSLCMYFGVRVTVCSWVHRGAAQEGPGWWGKEQEGEDRTLGGLPLAGTARGFQKYTVVWSLSRFRNM